MRYFIKFSYNGSKFYGFQRQKEKRTVQGTIENALSIINKNNVMIKGSGRTDIGVHANGQCAHFDLEVAVPPENLKIAINRIVHPYIHIIECEQVDMDFHARYKASGKKYVYKIWQGAFNPFKEDYYLQYDKKIDKGKLQECMNLFIGRHNFHNFVSGNRENSNGTIYNIEIECLENEIHIIFTGKSFYRYMVRNLVGAFLDYNEGKCDILLIKKMLFDDSFEYQLQTAPAKGLYLEEVFYE